MKTYILHKEVSDLTFVSTYDRACIQEMNVGLTLFVLTLILPMLALTTNPRCYLSVAIASIIPVTFLSIAYYGYSKIHSTPEQEKIDVISQHYLSNGYTVKE